MKKFFYSCYQIWLISFDVYRCALREKLMYGFLLLSFVFILLSNVPYMIRDPKVFYGMLPLESALQVGFGGINIFLLLIAVFVSLGVLQSALTMERLELFLVRPLSRWKIMAGVIFGLYQMLLINWFLMTAGIWLVIILHEPTLALFVWKGFSVLALVGLLYVSLVAFFYTFLPNVVSGVLTVFIVIASFGASSASQTFGQLGWPPFLEQTAKFALRLLPQIPMVLAVAVKELLIFRVTISPAQYIIHTVLLILLCNIASCAIFQKKSQF